jgi:ABC-type Fe3+ transport system permease subunit
MSAIYYQLPVLIVLISLVYSATRFDDWPAILHDTVRWSLRMAGFLVAVGLALYVVAMLPWM